jgi:hypothetical protein
MQCGGGGQQRRRDDREQQCDDVGGALDGVDVREARCEGQCQQEREEDLHPGLGDPQFLQQLGEVAVGSFQRSLVAGGAGGFFGHD